MNPKADFYFDKAGKWSEELRLLREVVLDCGLSEELKWGCPCYTFRAGNVVLIHVFRDYCALLFFKGALLHDVHSILTQQTENVQSARQIRFTGVQEIIGMQASLKRYIYEAIAVEEAGLKVPLKSTREYVMPEEFQQKLREMPALKTAFEALTPGRQRAYLLHFSQPKQSKTRVSRIETNIPRILAHKGLNDQ